MSDLARLERRLNQAVDRFERVEARLAAATDGAEIVKLGQEHAELKPLVDKQAAIIRQWMRDGKLAKADPHHLIFAVWAATQHYADFDAQVQAVLGPDRGGEGRFDDAARFIEQVFLEGLRPR